MATSKHDSNQVESMVAASNADGATPVRLSVDPATHVLQVSDDTTGSDNGGTPAPRDSNGVPVMMGVSSDDGVTPVAIYADPVTGALLINSA